MGLLNRGDSPHSELRNKRKANDQKLEYKAIICKIGGWNNRAGDCRGGSFLRGMIESGDFKIDLAKRTVTLRGQELRLTSEEFDVLVFLARHPQSLVTPHTMLATNWTANGLRQTEFLKALISLRKKLDVARTWQALSPD